MIRLNSFSINSSLRNKLQRLLLTWYVANKRDLPWRKTKDPYKILVSEIMLQQTQVEQVIPYYRRFIKRFPTITELAKSSPDDVLKIWEGLGYYRRAAYLHKAANIIVRDFGGKIPRESKMLRSLPGFGPYTCGSVLSIAYNIPQPAVDGNVVRFISRLFRIETDISLPSTKIRIEETVRRLFPAGKASEFTQALMEMGAIICTPAKPACSKCCVRKLCRAFNETPLPEALPRKKKKNKGGHFHIAAAVVRNGSAFLISRRPENVILGNLWEFPGGKKEKGESLEVTCLRELTDKTGVIAKLEAPLGSVKHHYSHYSITLHFFQCIYIRGNLKEKNTRWVKIRDLEKYAFPKVHKQMAMRIKDGYYS